MKKQKRKTVKRSKKSSKDEPVKPALGASFRQMLHFPEFRIEPPMRCPEDLDANPEFSQNPDSLQQDRVPGEILSDRMIAEIGTCLWYLKTRFFKRKWDSDDTSDDDPRVRRALGRLMKGIDALKRENVEIQDPTGKRYPQGGEHMMKPIQLQPTPGLTFEKVSETVLPMIFSGERLIQRGEVFVAVPQQESEMGSDESSENEKESSKKPAETLSMTAKSSPETDVATETVCEEKPGETAGDTVMNPEEGGTGDPGESVGSPEVIEKPASEEKKGA